MKLIVGLGNPGNAYERTRHNVGFMAIDEIAKANSVDCNLTKKKGIYTIFEKNGEKIILLKPTTFMNLSGQAVREFARYYKIPIENILIISDDLDMEVGKIKLKYKGSSGGHNGLKDIEQNLKTQEYKRLKIGISNDKTKETKNYVLGKFSKQELEIILSTLQIIPNIIDDFCVQPFDSVMSHYNKK